MPPTSSPSNRPVNQEPCVAEVYRYNAAISTKQSQKDGELPMPVRC
jgi:hypothetical protein